MNTKLLRQKILDLAIRGKLVPQDSKDEPASVLLERIRAEKEQLIKDKKIKPDKKNSAAKSHYQNEPPFEVPKGWEWVKIKDIFEINPKNNLDDDEDVSFIPMALIADGFSNEHKSEIRKWKDVKKGFTHFQEGDVGLAKITPCFENRKSVLFCDLENKYGAGTTELHVLRPIYESFLSRYALWFVKTEEFINNGISNFTGAVGQQRVGKNIIEDTYFSLPPLSEQQRIVAEIERLFALIDTVEESRLSLGQLVKQAKSKVLDLAIRGKLVPQNPDDEPASVLLERVRKAQKGKQTTADTFHYPFEIPTSWEWCEGSEIFTPMQSCKPEGESFKYIDIDAIDNQKHCVIAPKALKTSEAPSRATRQTNKGDVLFSMVRPYLRNIALVEEDNCIASTGFFVCKPSFLLNNKYLFYLLISDYVVDGLNQFMKGDNSPSINNEHIKSWLFPIPPLAEQQRIVLQIEKIFALFDEIIKAVEA